ncbi:MAG: FtsX-like permease family protein [Planctomycetota bacterium]
MRIPLKYNVRNLLRRKARTALTAFGIMLVVVVGVFMFAFSRGMMFMVKNSGQPENVIVMSRKAANCIFSSLGSSDYNYLRSLSQIKRDANGEQLISPQITHQSYVNAGQFNDRPGVIRGITPEAFKVNNTIKIIKGSPPAAGHQIAVGELTHTALGIPASELEVGREIEFDGTKWKIVGRFSAGGTAIDSEILAEMSDYLAALKRQTYSIAMLKLKDVSMVAPLVADLNARNDIQVKAISETDYYKEYSVGFDRIIFLAIVMSVIAGIGGLVGGMNTMYASVLGRIREIATLQVLGFGKRDIILSFIIESLIISLPGGIAGCLISLLVNGLQTKLSMGAFIIRVDWIAIAGGMLIAVFIGFIGALPPAFRATRLKITDALKYY